MDDRKFIEKTPFKDPSEAADIVIEMIQRAGSPGHVWYHQATDRVRVCAPDYQGDDGEMFLGVYTRTATRRRIAMDIQAARAVAPTVKRTRSVTVSETVETVQHEAPEPDPLTEVPVVMEVVPERPQALPAPVVAPAPALAAPAKDDAYGAAVWALVAQRDKIDARIAELQLLRFLFDRKASDDLAAMLEDYADLLETLGLEGEDENFVTNRTAAAREWAKRFALQQANDRSLFTRAAHYLAEMAALNDDCANGDTTTEGERRRAEAKELREIVSIFEFAAIKLPDPT